jgi:hypothetical protein
MKTTAKLSNAKYEMWAEAVYKMYYKHGMSRSQVLKMFGGMLSAWTLSETAKRLRDEKPDDPYVIAKQAGVQPLARTGASPERIRAILDYVLDKLENS